MWVWQIDTELPLVRTGSDSADDDGVRSGGSDGVLDQRGGEPDDDRV